MHHQFLALAALRHADFDFTAAFAGEGFREQRAFLEFVRHQHQPRRRLVIVELRHECAQDFSRAERAIGFREIGAVAPVLPGAKEKHLDAIIAAGLMQCEHVGFLDIARIDALMRRNRRERRQPVAIDRRALEIERVRGRVHFEAKFFLHQPAAAGEKLIGLAHQFGIAGEIDLLRAGRRAALDLIKQTRPRARLKKRIRAGAQQEGALQRIDGAVDRAGRCERPVIMSLARARAAMLEDLRRPVIGCDQDIGERLVVAQQHVEARTQPLDQIGFQQQRFGFGFGADEFHRHRRRDHAGDTAVVPGRPRIGGDPLLDVFRLADIEHLALVVDHAVDAGRRRRVLDEARDRGTAGGERAGRQLVEIEIGQRGFLFVFTKLAGRIDVLFRADHGEKIVRALVICLRYSATSLSTVRQARCWPPSTAMVTPVTLRACAK